MKVKFLFLIILSLNISMLNAQKPELVLAIGHTDWVNSASYSPDGKTIVTASSDHTAKIWDVETGKLLHSLKGHMSSINSATYSPDGKTIVTASIESTVIIWDAETGKLLHSLKGHGGSIKSATYSPDGIKIVSASLDDKAKIWNVETGKLLHTLEGHTHTVNSASYSPDGKTIVTTSFDNKAKIWNSETGKLLHTLEAYCPATYSPDGKAIVTASWDKTVKVWDTETGKLIHTLEGHTYSINSAAYSPDGKIIVTTSWDNTAKIWDAKNGELLHLLEGHTNSVESASFSPDGKTIVTTASLDETAKVWDAETGKLLRSLEGHSYYVNFATFSSDGKKIVTASSDNTAIIWDAKNGELLHSLGGNGQWVNSVSYSPDGKRMVTAVDEKAKVWDAETGKLLRTLEGHNDWIYSTTYSPNGEKIVTAGDEIVKIWDSETGKLLHSLEGNTDWVNSAYYSPDGKKIITAGDEIAEIWDTKTNKLLHSLEGHTDEINSATYSPDGKTIVTASYDHTVKIWDSETGKLSHSLVGTTRPIAYSTYSPDGKKIITTSYDHTPKIWDSETGKLLYFLNEGGAVFATYSPDGKTIVTASQYNLARIWDSKTGKLLHSLEGHTGQVRCAIYSPDGKTIITTSSDGSFIIWDAKIGKKLVQQFVFDDNEIITLTENGLFDATPGAMEMMYYVQDLEIIPLEAYYEQFYRPNLWERIMKGEEIEEASFDFENQKPAPDIQIIDDENNKRGVGLLSTENSLFDLNVQMTDRGGGIDEVRVFQNGKLIQSVKLGINSKDKIINQTFQIDLVSGINELKVTAFNYERTGKSEEITIAFTGEIQQVSNLYLLAIGINEYKKSSYNLKYAVPDADAFVKGVENGAKDIFGKVEVVKLTDSHATKQGISNAFSTIKEKAQQTDVFVFYYAGHGSMSIAKKNEKPVFYLLPHEITDMYNQETLESSAISANSLMEFSKDIKAQKQLFVLDACQSGGAVDMLASRGAVEERAIALLARSTGTYFLTASGSEQYASELSSLGHGVFTYALLQGLSGEADAANDNNVTVEELLPFVKNTVPALSEKHKGTKQYPVSYGFGQDFPMVVSGVVEIDNETKIPKGKYDGLSIEELEKMKKEAIENEDYLKANEIKIEIETRNE